MKFGNMHPSKEQKTQLIIIGVGLVVLLIVFIGTSYFYRSKMSEQDAYYTAQINTLNSEISSNKRTAYVPTQIIRCGQAITEENTQQVTVYSDVPAENFMTAEELGSLAKYDLQVSEPIYKSVITDANYNDVQEIEVSYIQLNTNLQDNDYVDIRIKFSNGEDCVVVAKISLRDLDLASSDFFLLVTEEQLLSLNGAVVDAYLNEGTIYVTKYVDPPTQEASYVDYQPPTDIMQRMVEDPNLLSLAQRSLSVDARRALEERLARFKETKDAYEEENGTDGRIDTAPKREITADDGTVE